MWTGGSKCALGDYSGVLKEGWIYWGIKKGKKKTKIWKCINALNLK